MDCERVHRFVARNMVNVTNLSVCVERKNVFDVVVLENEKQRDKG